MYNFLHLSVLWKCINAAKLRQYKKILIIIWYGCVRPENKGHLQYITWAMKMPVKIVGKKIYIYEKNGKIYKEEPL